MEETLPRELQLDQEEVTPEQVLATRSIVCKGEQLEQVLVQWYRRPPHEATLEDVPFIREQFPDFNLGDKVAVQGEVLLGTKGEGY